jgi:hypothetical protein
MTFKRFAKLSTFRRRLPGLPIHADGATVRPPLAITDGLLVDVGTARRSAGEVLSTSIFSHVRTRAQIADVLRERGIRHNDQVAPGSIDVVGEKGE